MADMNTKREKMSFRETISVIGKALTVSLKTKTPASMVIALLGFGFAFLPAIISSVLKSFTNEIQTMSTGGEYELSYVLTLFFTLIGLYVAEVVFGAIREYSLLRDGVRTNKYLCEKILDTTCRVKYKYIENSDDFLQTIQFIDSYAGEKTAHSIQKIISWLQYLVTFISVLYMLLSVNVWIPVILIVTSVPAAILAYLQNDRGYVYRTKYITEGTLVIHYFNIMCRNNPTNDIRHYRLYDHLKACWREQIKNYTGIKNKMTAKHVAYNSAADILRNVVYIGVLLLAALEIYKNPLVGLGTFTLVMSLSKQFQNVTTSLLTNAADFLGDTYYMKDFFSLDNLEKDETDETAQPYTGADIEIKNVDFTYPGGNEKVLKNINVRIKQGEKIAIVGENGSGKTTLVNLLCGMYAPDSGSITVDGHQISENITAVRRGISAVFQNFGKYEDTIRHNITVSDPARKVADEDAEIARLCMLTGFDECVKEQPDGIDEQIGDFAKKGNNLSGGQWQKLALTRALWRDKAKIMVLDEPTAALDPIAEADIYRNFAELTKDKTTILVSHRLGITSIVDRVLVFRDGEIIEDGSHKELLAKGGYYAEMYHAQAQWYTEEIKA